MREILFRGKRKDNGEWVEGCGIIATENWVSIFTVIDDIDENSSEVNEIEILPETVGQYTGLTDKNGKRIFEGDIVSIAKYGGLIYKVVYALCRYELVNSKGVNCFVLDIYKSKDIEVIGNIHDNPDMLKGGGNDG